MYGLLPRFASMRELHCLLFYLTRCYAGDPDLDKEEAMAAIRKVELSRFRESESLESPLLEKFARVGVAPFPPESTP